MSAGPHLAERAATPPLRPTSSRPSQRPTKISKWDRPPPPKDWRYFVGGAGKILIAFGLLTFGFVAYQLWGTGFETAREQSALGNQFEAAVEANKGSTTESTAEATPATTAPLDLAPVEPVDPEIDKVVTAKEQPGLKTVPNGAIMKMDIPALDIKDYFVLPTVSREDLKRGVGHFKETPWAGQLGNAAFAGHRTTYGGPFYKLDKLKPGDKIIVTRQDGNKYTYAVTGTTVVDPDDYSVITGHDPNEATIMLVTCTPIRTASQRMIVSGSLVPSESDIVGVPTYYSVENLLPTEEPASSADPAADPAAADSSAPNAQSAVTTEPEAPATLPIFEDEQVAATVAPDDNSDAVDADLAQDPAATAAGDDTTTEHTDGWDQGWFEDTDAFPQVAMWGAALLAIWILSRKIARWTRHDSIGVLVCLVPFVVCLYFVYQNVNRLLPPGI